MDIETLGMDGWRFCLKFMQIVNEDEKCVSMSDDRKELRMLSLDIRGMDLIWRIAITVKDNKVGTHAVDFLIDLFTCELGAEVSEAQRRRTFVDRCMTILRDEITKTEQSEATRRIVYRALTLLMKFLVF